MSNLTLDGSTSFIGTEFIKLLVTGSSNLATEEYVNDAIEQNGGGGNGNVDLSNYYTQTETDNLLNNKLNVNNPQDITGNLRLDPTNGLSKIILNAVSPPNANDDFYCNGSGHFNGTLRVSLLISDGDVNCDGCNADTFNSNIITNDIVFKHNDVEYMRFNATNDTIDLSKELNLGSSTLKINSLSTNGLNDMTFGVDTLGEFLRFNISDFTVRVPDNRSLLAQNIFTDIIKPVAFANDVVLNGGNSTNDTYEEYMRLDASDEKINFSKNVDMNEDLIMKSTKVLYLDATSNLLRYITTRNDNGQDILELVNNKATNNQIRFTNNGSTSLIVDNSFLFSERQIQGNNGLKVDFIDTRTTNADFQFRRNNATALTLKADNEVQFSGYILVNNISTPDNTDMALRRNDDEFIRLFKDGTTLVDAIICSKQLRANGQLRVNNLQINQFSSGVQFGDFRLENTDTVMRFYVGNGTSANFQMTNDGISLNRQTTINSIKTNIIDTNGDNDLIFRRNGDEFIKLERDTTPSDLIYMRKSVVIDNNRYIYTNNIRHDTGTQLNIWSTDSIRLLSNANNILEVKQTQIDFNANVSSGYNITCVDLIETSDKRLKDNIENVDKDCSQIVKNVNVKTYNLKNDDKKKNHIGFIAQEIKEILPEKFEAVVNEDNDYMGINYGKMSAILWKALQEEIDKREHIESRLFELEDIVKEMRGKKTTKPKAKPKSKTKAEK